MTERRLAAGMVVLMLAWTGACATRLPPPLPAALPYPEFMYPVLPPAFVTADGAERIDRGWRYLQNNDLGNAEREFSAAVQRTPGLYPAQAGSAYVALARRDHARAVDVFDTVLRRDATYVPALIGRGQALLALDRTADALASFEAALAVDPSLADVRRRVDVLQFRALQEIIDTARRAAAAGRAADARAAYARAIAASPESAFLHRELAAVERRQGDDEAALAGLRRAVELEPSDAASLIQIGEILEQRQDQAGAEAAYRSALAIEPNPQLTARLAAIAERVREERLPAAFRAIADAPRVTRGDLAALIGIRLEDVIRTAPSRDVVMTDAQGHWASSWIAQVARAGIIEPFPNHTFQPNAAITRADLAAAVSRVVALLSTTRADLRARLAERPQIADMAPGHLSYPAAAVAVASGVMSLAAGNRFEVARTVTGQEAVDTIARLRSLAGPIR